MSATKALPSYQKYISDFDLFVKNDKKSSWLKELRLEGLNYFRELKFPIATRSNEEWKHTNVNNIARTVFEYQPDTEIDSISTSKLKTISPWNETWIQLIFINGIFSNKLSSNLKEIQDIHLNSLSELASEENKFLKDHIGKYVSLTDNGFTAINTAFMNDGAVVKIPDNVSSNIPIHLIFISTNQTRSSVSYPRTLIFVGKNSKITVIESYVGLSDKPYFTNAVSEIVANENSKIEHYRYLAEDSSAFHIGTTRVSLEQNSTFNSTSLSKGAMLARNDLGICLAKPGSSCTIKGLYVSTGTQHIDNHIDIDHASPNSSSTQYFKGILDGKSRAVFSGRVLVRKDAQKTYARQGDKNLLLSEGARINTKPSLEIYADDVECYHGATAGTLASEALFYMQSRGIDEDTARRLLITGFADEILDTVLPLHLKNHTRNLFLNTINIT